jgi:DNA-binding PadR family transcriptional regulator
MAKPTSHALTELEGAALSVINRLGSCTPYQIRQDFLSSRSREWSGSAGAVYPAIRRMESAGLLRAEMGGDARRSVRYSLSAPGRRAYSAWLKDIARATGSGLDPFRCRADQWCQLPAVQRKALLKGLQQQLQQRCGWLEGLAEKPETPELQALWLELELDQARLRWLERQIAKC